MNSSGQIIKQELKKRCWTQGDLSDVLGVTEKHISFLVNDKCALTISMARKLEAAFKIPAINFLQSDIERRLKEHNNQ